MNIRKSDFIMIVFGTAVYAVVTTLSVIEVRDNCWSVRENACKEVLK